MKSNKYILPENLRINFTSYNVFLYRIASYNVKDIT